MRVSRSSAASAAAASGFTYPAGARLVARMEPLMSQTKTTPGGSGPATPAPSAPGRASSNSTIEGTASPSASPAASDPATAAPATDPASSPSGKPLRVPQNSHGHADPSSLEKELNIAPQRLFPQRSTTLPGGPPTGAGSRTDSRSIAITLVAICSACENEIVAAEISFMRALRLMCNWALPR